MGDWYRLGVQSWPGEIRVSIYSIVTENGSLYCLDTGAKTLERSPGEGGEKLVKDNKPIKYDMLLSELTVDTPLQVLWHLDGNPKVRTTSPITEIVRMDVSPSPD